MFLEMTNLNSGFGETEDIEKRDRSAAKDAAIASGVGAAATTLGGVGLRSAKSSASIARETRRFNAPYGEKWAGEAARNIRDYEKAKYAHVRNLARPSFVKDVARESGVSVSSMARESAGAARRLVGVPSAKTVAGAALASGALAYGANKARQGRVSKQLVLVSLKKPTESEKRRVTAGSAVGGAALGGVAGAAAGHLAAPSVRRAYDSARGRHKITSLPKGKGVARVVRAGTTPAKVGAAVGAAGVGTLAGVRRHKAVNDPDVRVLRTV